MVSSLLTSGCSFRHTHSAKNTQLGLLSRARLVTVYNPVWFKSNCSPLGIQTRTRIRQLKTCLLRFPSPTRWAYITSHPWLKLHVTLLWEVANPAFQYCDTTVQDTHVYQGCSNPVLQGRSPAGNYILPGRKFFLQGKLDPRLKRVYLAGHKSRLDMGNPDDYMSEMLFTSILMLQYITQNWLILLQRLNAAC